MLDATSTLPGVRVRFAPQGCTFTLAQAKAGVTIPYDVVIDADVAGVIPSVVPYQLDPGASGLQMHEVLSGAGQHYCVCDVGLGPGGNKVPITLKAGTFSAAFQWDGRNWDGPSDTGNPKGPPFPVGTYRLDVKTDGTFTDDAGTHAFVVAGAFRITLVP
jgi:hypothetical protein